MFMGEAKTDTLDCLLTDPNWCHMSGQLAQTLRC